MPTIPIVWIHKLEDFDSVEPPARIRIYPPLVPEGIPLTIFKRVGCAPSWTYFGHKTTAPDGTQKYYFKLGEYGKMSFEEALELCTKYRKAAGTFPSPKTNKTLRIGAKRVEKLQVVQPESTPKPEAPAPAVQTREVRYGVEMPKGWRTDAEIAAALEGKSLQQFLLDAILDAVKAAKEKEAAKAVRTLLDSGITLTKITELFNRIQKEK